MKLFRKFEGESGQAIVLLVLGMIGLLGMAGVAIDGGNLYTQKRRAQNAVDNAALAYALALNQETGNELTQANTVLNTNGYYNGQNNVVYSIASPPAGYDNSYVEVVLTATVPTAFIHFVYGGPAAYSVRAIAHGQASTAPMAGFAIVSLTNCVATGGNNLEVTGGGVSGGINVHNGNIFSNTPENLNNHCAYDPPNNGTGITVDSGFNIVSVGSFNYSGYSMMTVPVQTNYNGGVPINDPLASLSEPTCAGNGSQVGGVYQPGNYGGAGEPSIGWGTYAPGIYCITGGINPNGNGTIIGTGVLFYLKTGGITFTGNSGMTLSAPTVNNCLGTYGSTSASCTYVGMSIFMARNNTSTIEVRGNGGNAIVGTVYAVNGIVQARGGGSDPNETDLTGQIIASRVYGKGNGSFNVTYNEPSIYNIPPSIKLVE